MATWIHTYGGRAFDPYDPDPKAIDVEDIAHALAHQCRFSGHTRTFYSVADHSVRVSRVCDPDDALWGLLHDAAEAYIVDVPWPLKHGPGMAAYRALGLAVEGAVCLRFGLEPGMPESVRHADEVLLATEARDLMHGTSGWQRDLPAPLPARIVPLTPEEAKAAFLERFYELTEAAR